MYIDWTREIAIGAHAYRFTDMSATLSATLNCRKGRPRCETNSKAGGAHGYKLTGMSDILNNKKGGVRYLE